MHLRRRDAYQILEIARDRIQIMIEKGMDNDAQMLGGLIKIAETRINQIKSGEKPAIKPDSNAKYFAEVTVDLDLINEPMIADPDVNNIDISKRYTHDTIRPISFYDANKRLIWDLLDHAWSIRAILKLLHKCYEI